MKLSSIALCIGSALAFADTAPLYALFNTVHGYIVESSKIASLVQEYSDQLCSGENTDKLYIYRVANLEGKWPHDERISFTKHVHYAQASELDYPISDKCVVKYGNSVDSESGDAQVVVIDIDDTTTHNYKEFVRSDAAFIIQGKPTFHSKKQTLKDTLQDMHVDLDKIMKRGYESDEEDAEESIFAEVEADFRAAESMIAQEDAQVTAFTQEKEGDAQAAGKNTTSTSNLFTEYQFFTPGVWLALIVSLFLLYVITTAVGWVTSIETSYNAFEKQVDFEKKTE